MTDGARRIGALLWKELAELRRNASALLPVLFLAAVTVTLPFIIVVVVPYAVGEPLAGDADFARLATRTGSPETVARLGRDAAIQAFLFQQFLLVQLLIPVAGAMSFAGYSLIGEKQARTLEPLLATPLRTSELIIAKGLGALVPSLAILLCASTVYFAGIGLWAEPGVLEVVLNPRSAAVLLFLAPATSLVALQIGVLVSSRAKDPRTAQQFSAFLILPLTALFAVQFSGAMTLTVPFVLVLASVLLAVWMLLVAIAVLLFNREAILTRWQ
ncbi:MAG TPA: ABC transporter permease subunit [Vicinamibacterales bacterium]|nr:ABC transporter permease subunit [Vicinamibacterales bacterium]